MPNYASMFFTRRPAPEPKEIDGHWLVKAGARKLYGTSGCCGEAAGLYGLFDRDVALPAGKRGKFEEDVEMFAADVVTVNSTPKSKPAGFRKRWRSLRTLTALKPFGRRASKAAERMEVDRDLRGAPVAFTFTFDLRSSSTEPGEVLQHESDPDIHMSTADDADDFVMSFSVVSLVKNESSTDMQLSSPESMVILNIPELWRYRESTAALEDDDEDQEATEEPSGMRKADQGVSDLPAGDSLGSLVDLMEQWSFEAQSEETGVDSKLDTVDLAAFNKSKGAFAEGVPQPIKERETEVTVAAPTEPSVNANDTLLTGADAVPPSSKLSCSISALTVLSVDGDTDETNSAAEPTTSKSVPAGSTRRGFFWEARELSAVIMDEDEERPTRFLPTLDDDDGLAPATDSVDDLVDLFIALPATPRTAIAAEPMSLFFLPVLPPCEPSVNAVSTELQEDNSEASLDTSNIVEDEDEDEVWFDCVDTFEPEVVIEGSCTCAPAQPPAQVLPELTLHERKVLPGALYDHDEELDFDPFSHLRALSSSLASCVIRASVSLASWLASSLSTRF